MKIKIIRGSHEIGGSCVEFTSGSSRLILDVGMPLISSDGQRYSLRDIQKMPQDELIERKLLPAADNLFTPSPEALPVSGLVISHAHQDHYGLISCIQPDIPVYMSQGTRKLIEITALYQGHSLNTTAFHPFENNTPFTIGSFTITPYLMDHSAFDSYSFIIEAESKQVVYTGDFRAHGRKHQSFQRFLDSCPREVDALIMEGTVFGRQQHPSSTEDKILEDIIDACRNTDKLILFCCSSQNIDRLVTFYKAARKLRRTLVVDIYTTQILDTLGEIAHIPHPGGNYSHLRVYWNSRMLPRGQDRSEHLQLEASYQPRRVGISSLSQTPENYMMLIRPSMIPYLEKFDNLEGAHLIYSLWEGYLKEPSSVKLLEFIGKNAIQLHTIHTGGHADTEALQRLVDTLRPKRIIPFHTMAPEGYKIFGDAVTQTVDGESIEV